MANELRKIEIQNNDGEFIAINFEELREGDLTMITITPINPVRLKEYDNTYVSHFVSGLSRDAFLATDPTEKVVTGMYMYMDYDNKRLIPMVQDDMDNVLAELQQNPVSFAHVQGM